MYEVRGSDAVTRRSRRARWGAPWLKASNQGHKAYTSRVVAAAKDGSLQLGKFTAAAPTETDEGDVLEAGDVVAVPVEPGAGEPPPAP